VSKFHNHTVTTVCSTTSLNKQLTFHFCCGPVPKKYYYY